MAIPKLPSKAHTRSSSTAHIAETVTSVRSLRRSSLYGDQGADLMATLQLPSRAAVQCKIPSDIADRARVSGTYPVLVRMQSFAFDDQELSMIVLGIRNKTVVQVMRDRIDWMHQHRIELSVNAIY